MNHYKHDSKAHPPFVCPRSLAYMHIQLLGMWAKHDDAYGMPLVSMFLWEVQRMYDSHFLAKGLKPVMHLPRVLGYSSSSHQLVPLVQQLGPGGPKNRRYRRFFCATLRKAPHTCHHGLWVSHSRPTFSGHHVDSTVDNLLSKLIWTPPPG